MNKLALLLFVSACSPFSVEVGGSISYGSGLSVAKKQDLKVVIDDKETEPTTTVQSLPPSATLPYGKEFDKN